MGVLMRRWIFVLCLSGLLAACGEPPRGTAKYEPPAAERESAERASKVNALKAEVQTLADALKTAGYDLSRTDLDLTLPKRRSTEYESDHKSLEDYIRRATELSSLGVENLKPSIEQARGYLMCLDIEYPPAKRAQMKLDEAKRDAESASNGKKNEEVRRVFSELDEKLREHGFEFKERSGSKANDRDLLSGRSGNEPTILARPPEMKDVPLKEDDFAALDEYFRAAADVLKKLPSSGKDTNLSQRQSEVYGLGAAHWDEQHREKYRQLESELLGLGITHKAFKISNGEIVAIGWDFERFLEIKTPQPKQISERIGAFVGLLDHWNSKFAPSLFVDSRDDNLLAGGEINSRLIMAWQMSSTPEKYPPLQRASRWTAWQRRADYREMFAAVLQGLSADSTESEIGSNLLQSNVRTLVTLSDAKEKDIVKAKFGLYLDEGYLLFDPLTELKYLSTHPGASWERDIVPQLKYFFDVTRLAEVELAKQSKNSPEDRRVIPRRVVIGTFARHLWRHPTAPSKEVLAEMFAD
jgi:hypothetical protein